MTRHEQKDILIEKLGIEEAIDNIVSALSDDQMSEIFEYICRCWDIPTDEEDSTEED